ncbi:MAG: hypothetical protein WCA13_13700 [Terriglobales bacterium]
MHDNRLHDDRTRIATARLALLFCVFFLIACGLGYPILNRFDPRQTPGLSDVKTYAALVTGAAVVNAEDMRFRRFRVLVPWLARPFYRLARGRVATWDPVMFGLLVSDSLFVAGTALLIVVLGNRKLGSSAVGLVGALLYLVNFAVPNLRLVGLVDAGEGFFLLALLWCLSEFELWALPAIAVAGALTKESFIPFNIVFTSAWWLSTRLDRNPDRNRLDGNHVSSATWILSSWLLSLGAMIGLQWSITGTYISPLQFLALHRGGGYHFAASLHDRNLWYIFLWLLPTAIPNLNSLPKSWLIPVGATCVMAFVLDAYFGGAPGTVGRAFFSIAGPVLSLSSALLLLRISN